MSPQFKTVHGLHALIVAALFLTLSFPGWADESSQAAPASAVPPTGTGVSQAPAVAVPDPDKPKTPLEITGDKNTPDSIHSTPKPLIVHADRDFEIGRKVATLMEEDHYLQKPIDAEMSQHWLSNYFLALDPNHLFFLQGDIDEFTAKYGNSLGDLIHGDSDEAAVAPAFEIFKRYQQRVNEDVTLAEKVVHDKFDFTQDESFSIPTNKSPWLKDAAAAETTWRKEVKADMLNGSLEKKTPDATIKRLTKRYNSLLLAGQEMDDMDVLEAYLSALTHAYDPHSDYLSPEDTQDFTIKAINLSVTGIGAELRSDDGYATIENVIPGGPADLDKRLQVGDRIIAVGQGNSEPVDAVDMKLGHVVEMIRGHKGTTVHLVVLPAGGTDTAVHKDLFLKRDVVSIKDSLAKAQIIQHPVAGGGTVKIGVINLPEFYNNTATDVAKLILRLKKEQVAGIILDVRNNGGGLLDQAVDLTGLFVNKHEPVVQIRRSDGNIDQLETGGSPQIYGGPLLVMVNKASASATEIVAGALQDYGRAIVVGDQSTHGKGTVQTLISLMPLMNLGFPSDPGPGDLKLTIQKFYRVAGGSTQQKGVVPDIVLPSLLDALELGETTLPYYLVYDEVPKAGYDYLDLTSAYLPALRTNSTARVAASPDFNYVRHDIDYYRKKVQDPTVSLNLTVRQKQADDLKALNAQRKKDLEARKATRDNVLELTLDMVDQSLPAVPPQDKKPKVVSDDDSQGDADFDASLNGLRDDPQLDETVNIMSDYNQMLRDAGSKLVQASSPVPSK